MKKNIIMVIIILMCSISLLLVMYNFATKNIYYISENINNENIELSMTKIENGSTTTITETPTSGFYDISYECENNNATLYWSNSTYKLKVKVTNSPVKCSITFREINNDLNIISFYVDGNNNEVQTLDTSKKYYLDYASCYNSSGTSITKTIDFDSDTNKVSVSGLTEKVYCNIYLNTANTLLVNKIITDNSTSGKTITNTTTDTIFQTGVTTDLGLWKEARSGKVEPNVCNSTISSVYSSISSVIGSGANCITHYYEEM